MCWNFIVSTFSQKALNFFMDALNLRWNFVRNMLKFYCFYVFSKSLKFSYGCAEFALKLRKKCAAFLLFLRFLKSGEIFLRMRWKCCWNLCKNCTQNAVNLCKKCAKDAVKFSILKMRWNFQFALKFSTYVRGAFSMFQRISAHFLQKKALNRRWHLDPGVNLKLGRNSYHNE